VRALALIALIAAAGCFTSKDALSEGTGGDDQGSGSAAPPQCIGDGDCALAAPTCCECPTFAVPVNDPLHASCANVDCPTMTCPMNVAASCNQNMCELTCVAMTCPASCQVGYTIDGTGCLTCDCATAANHCTADPDCVEVRADCCGCAKGGADTSVATVDAAQHDLDLGCPTDPQCPGANVCELGAAPHCVEGSCALFSGGLPPDACGRADLPACPTGEVCKVNVDTRASLEGVGVCRPM
jgi:hypothetical protein